MQRATTRILGAAFKQGLAGPGAGTIGLAARGAATSSTAPVQGGPGWNDLVEVRQYTLKPEGVKPFLRMTNETAELRKQLNPGFLAMFQTDTGGSLTTLTHIYRYEDFDERDDTRARLAGHKGWQEYIDAARPHVQSQSSRIFLQAADVMRAGHAVPVGKFSSQPGLARAPAAAKPVVYEMRTYQLAPGYGTAPSLREAFVQGLPRKVEADPKGGRLALFGYTDVGTLNQLVEVWRYESAHACIKARQAARKVPEWRETIGSVTPMVQWFQSEFMHATAFSPWQ